MDNITVDAFSIKLESWLVYTVSRKTIDSSKKNNGFDSFCTLVGSNTIPAMDTSNPAPFVNAQLLPNYLGRKVRLVVQVSGSDGGGLTTATSTDDHHLTIKGLPPVPPMNYVEIIGIAETDQSVNAEIWTDFGTTFDTKSYNQLCQLANGEFRNLFL